MQLWKVSNYFMTEQLCIVREDDNSVVEGPVSSDYRALLEVMISYWNAIVKGTRQDGAAQKIGRVR